jgi:hypothetical protein
MELPILSEREKAIIQAAMPASASLPADKVKELLGQLSKKASLQAETARHIEAFRSKPAPQDVSQRKKMRSGTVNEFKDGPAQSRVDYSAHGPQDF